MKWNYGSFMTDINTRHYKEMEQTVNGLNTEQLNYQPKSNPTAIGWLIWHAAALKTE